MKRILIVDDEQLARDRLRRMLSDHSDYTVVAEAANGVEALRLVSESQANIVLLDIRMPAMDGLETARHFSRLQAPPAIIFCTAYDEYAIEAFDVEAVGYVLKPVRKEALLKALARANGVDSKKLSALATEQRSHLSVKTHLGLELVPIADISHFVADQKYVTAFYDGRELVIDESLKALEKEFGNRFLRVHRNSLVALDSVETLLRDSHGASHLKLRGVAKTVNVSRRHLGQVKKALKQR